MAPHCLPATVKIIFPHQYHRPVISRHLISDLLNPGSAEKTNSLSVSLTRTQLGYNVSGTTYDNIEGVFVANGASLGMGSD